MKITWIKWVADLGFDEERYVLTVVVLPGYIHFTVLDLNTDIRYPFCHFTCLLQIYQAFPKPGRDCQLRHILPHTELLSLHRRPWQDSGKHLDSFMITTLVFSVSVAITESIMTAPLRLGGSVLALERKLIGPTSYCTWVEARSGAISRSVPNLSNSASTRRMSLRLGKEEWVVVVRNSGKIPRGETQCFSNDSIMSGNLHTIQ